MTYIHKALNPFVFGIDRFPMLIEPLLPVDVVLLMERSRCIFNVFFGLPLENVPLSCLLHLIPQRLNVLLLRVGGTRPFSIELLGMLIFRFQEVTGILVL